MKSALKGLLLLLLLFCMAAPADAATYAVGSKILGYALADDDTCTLLLPPGTYEAILPLTGGFFSGRMASEWMLLQEDGTPALEEAFEEIATTGSYLLLKHEGLFAIYDANLYPLTEHSYTQVVDTGAGSFLALKTDPHDDRGDAVYCIDATGTETAVGTVTVYGLNPFSCGMSAAVGAGNKRSGYVGVDGQWRIGPQYGYGSDFSEWELAAASMDSGVGLIDIQGNWVVMPKYTSVSLSPGNCLAVLDGEEGLCLLNMRTGETVLEVSSPSAYARTRDLRDMTLLTVDGLAKLYDSEGNLLVSWPEEQGASVQLLGENHLLLYRSGAETLLSLDARPVLGPDEHIGMLSENVFYTRSDSLFTLYDAQGNVLMELTGQALTPLSEKAFCLWDADCVSVLPLPQK